MNLTKLLNAKSIRYPFTSFCKQDFNNSSKFLIKEVAGMGGGHVTFEAHLDRKLISDNKYYYQEYIEGTVYSAVFLANGMDARLIGINQHLKSTQFSSKPFLYEGAITTNLDEKKNSDEINFVINKITKITKLFGLCGIDFIVDKSGSIYVIDVNPRPPSTFELHESKHSLFADHIDCFKGNLSNNILPNHNKLYGHIIYYAKDDLAKFPSWPHWVKDIPEAGTKVSAGNPVCSIYAEANSPNEVKNLLYRRLRKIELSIKSINKL